MTKIDRLQLARRVAERTGLRIADVLECWRLQPGELEEILVEHLEGQAFEITEWWEPVDTPIVPDEADGLPEASESDGHGSGGLTPGPPAKAA